MPRYLPQIACVILVASFLSAQEPLPASTQAWLAKLSSLRALTQSDFTDISSKARSGDKEAQYWMALLYGDGQLIPQDDAAARDWMLKSAEQGYTPAQEGMGRIYLGRMTKNSYVREYGDADRWFRLAATQGNAEAQFWLGTGYEQGWFGGIDYNEAVKWLRRAADQGYPNAQFCLGQMYEEGHGVHQNNVVAARWYRRAADHILNPYLGGVWEAQVELANIYRDGRLPRDNVQAYMWLAVFVSSLDPPKDDDLKKLASHMTQKQILEAQRGAEDWVKRHTSPEEPLAKRR